MDQENPNGHLKSNEMKWNIWDTTIKPGPSSLNFFIHGILRGWEEGESKSASILLIFKIDISMSIFAESI